MSATETPLPNVLRWTVLARAVGSYPSVNYPYPALILAQIHQESAGDPEILTNGATPCTPQGGRGLLQPTPFWEWKEQGFTNCADCDNAYKDPGFNLRVGLTYMSQYLTQTNGNILDALELYNTGKYPAPNYEYAAAVLNKVPMYEKALLSL